MNRNLCYKYKKKVIATVMVLMLVVIMALTGCATEETAFKINSDGSGSYVTVVTYDLDAMTDAMIKMGKSMGATDAERGSRVEIRKSLAESFVEQGCKKVTVDGKECYQQARTQKIKKGNLTKDIIGDSEGYVTADTFYIKFDAMKEMATAMKEADGTAMSESEMQTMIQMYGIDMNAVKISVSVEFAKAVTSTNGTIDVTNKNKASFSATLADNKTMFATTNSKVTLKTAQSKYKTDNTIKATKIKKLKANKVSKKAKKATVSLKFTKVSGAKNYQIQYSTKSSFKKATKKTVKKTTCKISKLKKNTKYYVRVRAVKYNLAGKEVTSKWSKKSVKTKK